MISTIPVTLIVTALALTSNRPPVEYQFVQDTERRVGILRGQTLLIGHLDADGEFHQSQRVESVKSDDGMLKVIAYSGPSFDLLNRGEMTPRRAYEFRSGMLIPGHIHKSGNFVPEKDGTIVTFATYRHANDSIPIWNLPGRFEPVKPPGLKK